MSERNEKAVSIVATVGIMLILSLLGIVGVSLLGSSSSLGLGYMQSQQAFYIAEAGIEWYTEQLKNYSDWSVISPPAAQNFAGGTFTITFNGTPTRDAINITSTGTMVGYEGQSVKRVTTVYITRQVTFDAYESALYVGGKIDTTNTENFTINGNSKEDQTDFPTVDFAYYQGIADHAISGNHSFAAGTYSGIWYIDGSVDIASDVTINGSVIATGNINMNNNSNIIITASLPYPALVTDGNLLFQNTNNITINGLVYVGANLSGNFLSQKAENINFTGTIIVRGNFNLQGSKNVTITYDPSILNNPPPGFSGATAEQVLDTADWSEVL